MSVIPVLGLGFWLWFCRTMSLVQAGRRGRCAFLKGIRTDTARGWLLAATPATRRRRAHNPLDYDALEYFLAGHWQCLGRWVRRHMLTGLWVNWTWQLIVTSLQRNGIFVHGWCGRQMPGSICGNRLKRGLRYGCRPGRGSEVRHIVGGGRDIHPTAEADTGPRCKINATNNSARWGSIGQSFNKIEKVIYYYCQCCGTASCWCRSGSDFPFWCRSKSGSGIASYHNMLKNQKFFD
jgi:hypothetical protein